MVQRMDRKLRTFIKQAERLDAKIEKLKRRHAHDLMNDARELLGKAPKKFGATSRATRKSTGKGPTFSGKPANGGKKD